MSTALYGYVEDQMSGWLFVDYAKVHFWTHVAVYPTITRSHSLEIFEYRAIT